MPLQSHSRWHRTAGLSLSFLVLAALGPLFKLGPVGILAAQETVTRSQRQEIQRIKTTIDRGGRLFQSQRYAESADTIRDAQQKIESLAVNASVPLIVLLTPQHERLRQAHQLLSEAGQNLPVLKPLPRPGTADGEVSFSSEIAGFLNSKCGNCHVRGRRGNFAMPTYQALMGGMEAPVVVPGKPEESRLVEVIEDGDMPQGGGSVSEEELTQLKQWISEGAKFDGRDPTANLAAIAAANVPSPPEIQVARATGRESVSFALNVAPHLVERCAGCHFEPQNLRGGLNMTTFAQLLRGGESGSVVTPGNSADSLLIKRLKGDGVSVMPPGNRPLAGEAIDRIAKWIDEGARFDGPGADMNLRTVSSIVRAATSSHEELSADRRQRALASWTTVMSDIAAKAVDSPSFVVLGTQRNGQLEEVSSIAESLSTKLKSELKINKNAPLVKGKIAVYVFGRRYDYSEFGKMIEQRDLPRAWRAHWNDNTIDSYIVLLTNDPLEELQADLAQRIAAVGAANLGVGVPSWFANGYGYLLAEDLISDRSVLKKWEEDASSALASMLQTRRRPADLIENRMPEEQAALVAYALVKNLVKDGRRFQRLLTELRSGDDFDTAFTGVYSIAPAEMVNQFFGQPSGAPGNRRRR